MDKHKIKKALYNLNNSDFINFSYELFKEAYGKNINLYKENRLKAFIRNLPVDEIVEGKNFEDSGYKGIYLIDDIPFELFENPEDIIIDSPYLRKKLSIIRKDRSLYQDDYRISDNRLRAIYFINNLKGFPIDFYINDILSKYENIVGEMGLLWNLDFGIYTGNPDTFMLNWAEHSNKALQKISKENVSLSIDFSENLKKVRYTNQEKYLQAGVCKSSHNPLNPILTNETIENRSVVLEFEQLLKENPNENKLEKFIQRYYQEIFGFKYDRIESQIWLKFPELDINKKKRRLDIFLHNSVSSDWELFELKRIIPLAMNYRDIPTLSSEIYKASQQVLNYERILRQDKVKNYFLREGIEYFEPSLHLVVGNSPTIPNEQWRWLVSSNKNVKIITYGELLKEMNIRMLEKNID